MARGAIAQPDDVFTFWFQREVRVEGGDPKNPCRGNAQSGGNVGQDFFGKVAVFLLYCL